MTDDLRFGWMVEVMNVRPDDRILEIGPGSSNSLACLAARLDNGYVVGADRSATAIARAAKRHAALIESGKVRLIQAELADLEPRLLDGTAPAAIRRAGSPPGTAGFDKILAVNVNVFWTKRPVAELALIHRLLAPGGALYLFYGYGAPAGTSTSPKPAEGQLKKYLAEAGFTARPVSSGDLLGVIATAE
ncbi:class I SAM-dependent methyltransferase [Nocardia altamirensis]|uniref:class I SAM-dependent methyltransferase n=1 Tax=Nocardia altamirensis TaxID=472158 RepID=UPI001FE1917B|nr:class I SAM-dependent methyltransferase [Nocardia altamirensis]